MSDPGRPAEGAAPQFIRSVLRSAGSPPPSDVEALVEAHGYKEPQPPPGTDARLWCAVHHRKMAIVGGPWSRRISCPQCLPKVWRYNQPFGLRCARQGCGKTARYDLWGVPVCGSPCVQRIGDGCPVRPRAVALRVIAYQTIEGYGPVVLAFFWNGYRRDRTIEDHMIRVHWWLPAASFGRITILRRPRTAKPYGSPRDMRVSDEVIAALIVRLARARVAEARAQLLALNRWRNGKGPRPWADTTLQGILDRAWEQRAEHRARRADARRMRRLAWHPLPHGGG
jgi:hypothetical protein